MAPTIAVTIVYRNYVLRKLIGYDILLRCSHEWL